MSPLGSSSSARLARSRSRSRSPQAKPAARGVPQIKDWVLTRVSTRYWCKAVPALVSKVTVGITPEDCSLCLVLPNRFALQYGFGSTKKFLELSDVPLRDVRPYCGADQVQLHAALLKAIRDSRMSMAARDVCGSASSSTATVAATSDLECSFSSGASLASHDSQMAPVVPNTQDEIPAAQAEPVAEPEMSDGDDDDHSVIESPRSPAEPSGEEADSESEESEPAARSRSQSATGSDLETESTQEVLLEEQLRSGPQIQELDSTQQVSLDEQLASGPLQARAEAGAPETPQGRSLVHRESEPKKVNSAITEPVLVSSGKQTATPCIVEKVAAPPVNAAARLLELTKAVARAFKGACSEELTRQEIANAVGHSFGEEELQQGLEKLDQAQKIFLTGDLVFLV